jgi:hypothetical protein
MRSLGVNPGKVTDNPPGIATFVRPVRGAQVQSIMKLEQFDASVGEVSITSARCILGERFSLRMYPPTCPNAAGDPKNPLIALCRQLALPTGAIVRRRSSRFMLVTSTRALTMSAFGVNAPSPRV